MNVQFRNWLGKTRTSAIDFRPLWKRRLDGGGTFGLLGKIWEGSHLLLGVIGALLLTFSSGVVDVPANPPPPPPPSEVALHRALGMQGMPYVTGGADPSVGFDCSGLTHWAYAQSGTMLSRTSWGQWDEAKRVQEPQPGDLVFFDTYGGVSHVGINIDGKTFIHAVDHGQPVEITSYDEPYWSARLVGFGRVDY